MRPSSRHYEDGTIAWFRRRVAGSERHWLPGPRRARRGPSRNVTRRKHCVAERLCAPAYAQERIDGPHLPQHLRSPDEPARYRTVKGHGEPTPSTAQPLPPEPVLTPIELLRARAERCRRFAREYSSEAGTSLEELAAELDKAADQLESLERS